MACSDQSVDDIGLTDAALLTALFDDGLDHHHVDGRLLR